jgi:hypothetical protein
MAPAIPMTIHYDYATHFRFQPIMSGVDVKIIIQSIFYEEKQFVSK